MAAVQQNSSGDLCLERIEALRQEITRAIAAISGDTLGDLEESLWRQEVLCVGLKHLLPELRTLQPRTLLAVRLGESMSALQELNRTYAELLRQAQSSNKLLLRLCHHHHGAAHIDTGSAVGKRYSLEA